MSNVNSLANLWGTMSDVQRRSLLQRANVAPNLIADHANKDWTKLPSVVQGALVGVK